MHIRRLPRQLSIFSSKISFPTLSMSEIESFEKSVGISHFANEGVGFNGILKHRFSDFVVREVSLDGKVSALVDTCGKELELKWFPPKSSADETVEDLSTNEFSDRALADVQALLPVEAKLNQEKSDELKAYIQSCLDQTEDCPQTYIGIPASDKVVRTSIHNIFKKKELTPFIDSDTQQVDGVSVVRLVAKHKNKGKQATQQFKRNPTWPQGLPNFLQFTLFKENIDTMSALNIVHKTCHMKPNAVSYNGTKDKRGVTAQKCTVYRRRPSDFAKINAYKHVPTIRIGDFEYVSVEAGLGALTGNRFEIVLRELDRPRPEIEAACQAMERSGFINYYGLQRFGRGANKSHEYGRAIFKGDFKTAVNMLFTANDHDKENIRLGKLAYFEGNFQKALNLLPESMYGEKCAIQKLMKSPDDFMSAYQAMPKNSRLICAHAYQSYIWNLTATRRVELYGLQVVVGDLVAVNSEGVAVSAEDLAVASEENVALAGAGTGATRNASAGSAATGNSFQRSKGEKGHVIRPVTAEEVATNKFTIHDVILPLPGQHVILPTNEIGDYFTSLLAKDGLTTADYATCHNQYRLNGAYRRVLQKPGDFQWEVVEYADKDAEIATTELTALRAAEAIASAETGTTAPAAVKGGVESGSAEPKVNKYTALQLKFTLPPGTYATMLLREITKQSTESSFQAQLSSADQAGGPNTHGVKRPASALNNSSDGSDNKEESDAKVTRVD